MCVEWAYACNGGSNTTLWYHHFHKAGGSTFVKLAEANGARLHRWHENGNPVDAATKERITFWKFSPLQQAAWIGEQRRMYGTDMVVSEFGFSAPDNFLAPLPIIYITVHYYVCCVSCFITNHLGMCVFKISLSNCVCVRKQTADDARTNFKAHI